MNMLGNARLQEKQVLMKSAIETLSQVRQQIHSIVSIDTQANTTTAELESIGSEIRSLIRLLKQEASKSPDVEAAKSTADYRQTIAAAYGGMGHCSSSTDTPTTTNIVATRRYFTLVGVASPLENRIQSNPLQVGCRGNKIGIEIEADDQKIPKSHVKMR